MIHDVFLSGFQGDVGTVGAPGADGTVGRKVPIYPLQQIYLACANNTVLNQD